MSFWYFILKRRPLANSPVSRQHHVSSSHLITYPWKRSSMNPVNLFFILDNTSWMFVYLLINSRLLFYIHVCHTNHFVAILCCNIFALFLPDLVFYVGAITLSFCYNQFKDTKWNFSLGKKFWKLEKRENFLVQVETPHS